MKISKRARADAVLMLSIAASATSGEDLSTAVVCQHLGWNPTCVARVVAYRAIARMGQLVALHTPLATRYLEAEFYLRDGGDP